MYQINVCRSILPFTGFYGTECQGAGACQTKPSNPAQNLYDALGQIHSPTINNGVITLSYTTPDRGSVHTCHTIYTRAMQITFQCYPGSLGTPVFLAESPSCVYSFLWQTSAACSLTQFVGQQCKVRDPTSGLAFDLTPLSQTDYSFTSADGTSTYTVHVCGAVTSTNACGNNAGGCVQPSTGNAQSIGLNNSALIYSDVSLELTYTSGASCPNNQQRSTVIQFVCNTRAGNGQPALVTDDGCTTIVRWETAYACASRESIPCVYLDPNTGLTYDLSPLAQSASNFATNDSQSPAQFAVSVCHSLLPTPPLASKCSGTTGICEGNGTTITNLGSVSSLSIINGSLVATYLNGDVCGPNNTLSSSQIVFQCASNSTSIGSFSHQNMLTNTHTILQVRLSMLDWWLHACTVLHGAHRLPVPATQTLAATVSSTALLPAKRSI